MKGLNQMLVKKDNSYICLRKWKDIAVSIHIVKEKTHFQYYIAIKGKSYTHASLKR